MDWIDLIMEPSPESTGDGDELDPSGHLFLRHGRCTKDSINLALHLTVMHVLLKSLV